MKMAASRAIVLLVLLTMCSMLVAAETVRWIPAAASNAGFHGSQWTTDLWIYNKVADRAITVYLAFLPDAEGVVDPVEVPVELPIMNPVYIRDVVGSLFSESRPGAIRLRSEHPFEARSRTLNSGSDVGTFGQGIPAVIKEDADLGSGVLLGASNQPTANGSRTNLGLLNTSDEEVRAYVFVWGDSYQDWIGRAEINLGPLGWWQGDVFDLIGVADAVDNAMINPFVFSEEQDQPLISYLSVVDNASGDGAYVAEIDYTPVYTELLDWTIDLAITAQEADVDQVTITVDDMESWVFTDPTDQIHVTLDDFVGMFRMCFTIEATATGGSNPLVSVDWNVESNLGDNGGGALAFGVIGDDEYEHCAYYAPIPRCFP